MGRTLIREPKTNYARPYQETIWIGTGVKASIPRTNVVIASIFRPVPSSRSRIGVADPALTNTSVNAPRMPTVQRRSHRLE
jgi:hypothetical protein